MKLIAFIVRKVLDEVLFIQQHRESEVALSRALHLRVTEIWALRRFGDDAESGTERVPQK